MRAVAWTWAAVAAAGLVLEDRRAGGRAARQNAMGASWRIAVDDSERTDLVTNGPFRRIRNPIFTGMAAVAAGVALLVPSLIAVLALVCPAAAVQIQVRVVEEPFLRRTHHLGYAG